MHCAKWQPVHLTDVILLLSYSLEQFVERLPKTNWSTRCMPNKCVEKDVKTF